MKNRHFSQKLKKISGYHQRDKNMGLLSCSRRMHFQMRIFTSPSTQSCSSSGINKGSCEIWNKRIQTIIQTVIYK